MGRALPATLKAQRRRRYERRLAAGVCPRCGKDAPGEARYKAAGHHCLVCRSKGRAQGQRRREIAKTLGLCSLCCSRPASTRTTPAGEAQSTGGRYCERCREQARILNDRRRSSAPVVQSARKCPECGARKCRIHPDMLYRICSLCFTIYDKGGEELDEALVSRMIRERYPAIRMARPVMPARRSYAEDHA